MKIINVMNFVRQCEPRDPASDAILFETTEKQLALVNEEQVDNTFLLQYDALCDEKYVELFKTKATKRTELGFWYEVVEPLTTDCDMPYKSEYGWKWDWHITPGFSMAYTVEERERLIDQAMKKFKEVFGYYPRTVGSWLLDTHTVNYLSEHYQVDAFCICRDQVNVDAYTLVGGYFNQAYYPCKNNMFTPAQSQETQVNTPMFRLLGSDPVHNYDGKKYLINLPDPYYGASTLEVAWETGYTPYIVDWFFKSYFKNEDLGFSYAQIGQENSFGLRDLINPLRMQIQKIKNLGDVVFQKMGDTGRWFKDTFDRTPQTAVVATDDWNNEEVQSVYYDCQKYTLNVFRYKKQIFIRAWYLFKDEAQDKYLKERCDSFYAVYENMPIVDTARFAGDKKENIGILLDDDGVSFMAKKNEKGGITVYWGDKSIACHEDGIEIVGCEKIRYYLYGNEVKVDAEENRLQFCYGDQSYEVKTENCQINKTENGYILTGSTIKITV